MVLVARSASTIPSPKEVGMNEERDEKVELSFSEAMLSDIAADVAKVRRNTSFLAGVLLAYLVVIALSFAFVFIPGD